MQASTPSFQHIFQYSTSDNRTGQPAPACWKQWALQSCMLNSLLLIQFDKGTYMVVPAKIASLRLMYMYNIETTGSQI